jgi:hypothetical protein
MSGVAAAAFVAATAFMAAAAFDPRATLRASRR